MVVYLLPREYELVPALQALELFGKCNGIYLEGSVCLHPVLGLFPVLQEGYELLP